MRGTTWSNAWSPFISYLHQRDLPNCLTSCQPRMYFDDSHISYADVDANSIQLHLNHDLGNLKKWLISNKLTLKTAKTEFMLLGSRQKLRTLSRSFELSIDYVPKDKFLLYSRLEYLSLKIYCGKHTSINYLKRSR